MEVITIQTEAFQTLLKSIDEIKKHLKKEPFENSLPDKWITIEETCKLLHCSKRCLQNYRDQGILSFSQFQGKIYFRASDIQEHLEKNYKKAFKK